MVLRRKIENDIRSYLSADSNKMMIVDGARQVGKSFIISQEQGITYLPIYDVMFL